MLNLCLLLFLPALSSAFYSQQEDGIASMDYEDF